VSRRERPEPARRPPGGDPGAGAASASASEAGGPDAGVEAPPPPAEPVPGGTTPGAGESAEAYKDRWLRAEAELQNFRRRSLREWDEARRSAEERVMLEMITAIDDLDRALEAAREAGATETWTEGVRLTVQRLREYLARQGVVTLEPLGEPFDPTFHEAMLEIDAPAGRAPGDVVQVVLKGYARGDRALRPARVIVARAPADPLPGVPQANGDA
jgi:molecular chaperone GrpE